MEYNIIDISEFEIEEFEQLGTKSKFWYEDNNGDSYLFKSIKTQNKAMEDVFRYGEDWAEKIASELAELLGIPHAKYELATYNGMDGVISPNFILGKGERLSTGNELIERMNATSSTENDSIQRITRVFTIMERIIKRKPIGFKELDKIKTASDFFVGYLMLDSLISNQDRHVENWGMIETDKATTHLAPSFDHAASLGRNESDEKRRIRLDTNDIGRSVETYVLKAKSHFYNTSNSRLKILQAFENSARINPSAAMAWLERLSDLEDSMIYQVISRVPEERMSFTAKQFAYEIIRCNKNNLLKLKKEINTFIV
ncbi:HipA domain-containing protein [Buttiauxella ferragutiae]|uniref:HipA domain-containing protein n=1 Tax=Buttiauxella ferragutiae TaxID=82989 RepID=UPI001F533A94|nr:HipA domain-containing protein [Buttiauxella ferragutiae]UNK61632.1 HipA domain-containing protein [Buttiauxella ferragutiae]